MRYCPGSPRERIFSAGFQSYDEDRIKQSSPTKAMRVKNTIRELGLDVRRRTGLAAGYLQTGHLTFRSKNVSQRVNGNVFLQLVRFF